MKHAIENFIFDERLCVYMHPENIRADFDYSDGREVEERIFRILKETKDHGLFSRELCSRIMDWPTEYHFSPVRHNLLRHYRFRETDQILELGCGCGAITRQLGESGASVTAIEGSKSRAQCAAERCRDLDNVKIYCSNFQDVALTHQYDYVTLIGVLEYSSIYFIGDEPFKQCLEIAKAALKKDGKLIIAIENRLGLKYFLGYSEDHTGAVYDGLQDFYEKSTAYTFGKKEITDLLMQNDFVNIDFAYPFPDYKLPKAVIFDTAFEADKFCISDIISQIKCRCYSFPHKDLPSGSFIWQQLENNGLLEDLANSFLIETSLSGRRKDGFALAKYYTVDRKREFNTETSFMVKDSKIKIIKKRLENLPITQGDTLLHVLSEDEYAEGRSLDHFLTRCMAKNNFKEFIEYFKVWLDFILDNSLVRKNTENVYHSILKDKYIDAKPKNLILRQGVLTLIDTEWEYKKEVTVYSLIIRYLLEVDFKFINRNISGKKDPISKVFDYLKIKYSNKIYKQFELLENDIAGTVYDSCCMSVNGYYPGQGKTAYQLLIYKIKTVLKKIRNKILSIFSPGLRYD